MSSIEQRLQQWQFGRRQQYAFLQDLCSLIEDGVPASQAIDTIYSITDGSKKAAAKSIADSIANGQLIADGMQGWFSVPCIAVVRVGETSGTLVQTLQSTMRSLAEDNDALRVFLTSLVYPVMVLVLAAAVIVFVKKSVLDSFAQIQPETLWPPIGKTLFTLAMIIQQAWWTMAVLLVLLFFTLRRMLVHLTGSLRLFIDRLPLLSLYRRVVAARFMENIGLLLTNGLVMKQALSIVQQQATPYLQWHVMIMEQRLSGGKENIADVLDTQLIDTENVLRLRVIAKGKGFAPALLSLGAQAHARNVRAITLVGRIAAGVILIMAALLAVMIVVGIYTVGSAIAV